MELAPLCAAAPSPMVGVLELSGGAGLRPELVARYGCHVQRRDRVTRLQGEPFSDDRWSLYDGRVWEYMVWLGEGSAPADPFEAAGKSAWKTINRTLDAYGRHLLAVGVGPAVVADVRATLKDFHTRDRHGGNHLGPDDDTWLVTPRYRRVREFPLDREKRDAQQRERTRIAAAWALERGELHPREYAYLSTMLDLTDKKCTKTWHKLVTIGKHAGGFSATTAGRWMKRLHEKGWVQREHHTKVVDGHLEAAPNLWRIDIPTHLRVEIREAERRRSNETRAKKSAGKPGRYTPPAGPAADVDVDEDLSPWADPAEWAELAAVSARRSEADRQAAARASDRGQAVLDEDARSREEHPHGRAVDPPEELVAHGAQRFAEIRALIPTADVRGRQVERAPP